MSDYSIRADRIRKHLQIYDAIAYLGLQNYVRGGMAKRVPSQTKCFFHAPDNHPSGHLYDDSKFYCFSCKISVDTIGLVALYKDIPRLKAVEELEKYASLPPLKGSVLVQEIKDILNSQQTDNRFGESLKSSILEHMEILRDVLKLDHQIMLWRYYDHLLIHFKEIKDINRSQYLESMKQLLKGLQKLVSENVGGGLAKRKKKSIIEPIKPVD